MNMKKMLRTALLAVVITGTSFVSNAQKIAHINLDSLVSLMPESKEAQKAQQDYLKQLEGTVTAMQTELQTKYQDYLDNQTKLTDLIKKNKEKELQDLDQRIKDFQTNAQQDLQKKNEELGKPVLDKARKAIDQVAKENGYKYVLDTSTGIVLYSEPTDDIFPLVKKKLNITAAAPAPTNGGTPAPKK